ncbi:thiamine phosphate synthase [Mariprofundus erugo]|uniref:thiamine phosphate synthase n=1 Tax=Mariprofundus erugo TaxID=2528639 RepID=UPI0010FD6948|nr:thiamine phosphate synthase [Mariprofundus erugo]TLS77313.1 thiamine phosphate synthase [Mariprofundus erugo]
MPVIPPVLTQITDSSRYHGEPFFEALEQMLAAGVDAVLLREKALDSARLLALAARLRVMTRACGARLIIHTQADIAEAVDADGVHLAGTAIASVPAVRGWLADRSKTVSVSCHHEEDLHLAADAGADYALLSPVFPTASHPGAPCLGVTEFHRMAMQAPLPVVALGGMTPEHASELNWPHVAVISGLLSADDPAMATRRMRRCMPEYSVVSV